MGFGHHARRIYYSILSAEKEKFNFIIIDLNEQKESIGEFLFSNNHKPLEIVLIDQFSEELSEVPVNVEKRLDEINKKYKPAVKTYNLNISHI